MSSAGPKRVALYARISKAKKYDSDEKTTDINQDGEAQLQRMRKWVQHNEFEVAGEFHEVASGRLVRRPEQERVMKLVRAHHVHGVVVVKLDRWGRSLIDLKNTVNEMVESGVTFYAIESGITYDKHTPAGKLFLSQLAAFAEFEADLISERTKEGLAARRDAGVRLGRPLQACYTCEGERTESLRKKIDGKARPVCRGCKLGG